MIQLSARLATGNARFPTQFRLTAGLALLVAGVLAVTGTAVAQTAPACPADGGLRVRTGVIVECSLRADEQPVVFLLDIAADSAVQLDVQSLDGQASITPSIAVYNAAERLPFRVPIAQTVDIWGSTSARLNVYRPVATRLWIEVTGMKEGLAYDPESEAAQDTEPGNFELLVRRSDFRPDRTVGIALPARGAAPLEFPISLASSQGVIYTFAAAQGDNIVASLSGNFTYSPEFTLVLGDPAAGDIRAYGSAATNGDYRISYAAMAGGVYSLLVRAPYGASGDYRLKLVQGAAATDPAKPLPLDQKSPPGLALGWMSAVDPASNAPYVAFELKPDPTTGVSIASLAADKRKIAIALMVPDFAFDPKLDVGFLLPNGIYASMMSNDDFELLGLDSRIELDLAAFENDPSWLDNLQVRATSSYYGVEGGFEIFACLLPKADASAPNVPPAKERGPSIQQTATEPAAGAAPAIAPCPTPANATQREKATVDETANAEMHDGSAAETPAE